MTILRLLLALTLPFFLAGCASAEANELPSAGDPLAAKAPDLEAIAVASPTEPRSKLAARLIATGSSHPTEQAALAPKATGILSELFVKEGDRVKRGQTLFRLEAATARLQVARAEAALAGAKVQLQAATQDHARATRLFDNESISMAELDRANAAMDGARAAVMQAQASVSLARKEAQDAAVTSPIEGVIVGVHAHRGETVTMMPPTVVVEVHRLHPLEIRAKLPEGALRTIREGDPIQVRFTALGEVREARIRHIAPRVDAVTRMVEVRAEVANENLVLRSGMMVEVEVAGQDVPRRAEAPDAEASTQGGNPS